MGGRSLAPSITMKTRYVCEINKHKYCKMPPNWAHSAVGSLSPQMSFPFLDAFIAQAPMFFSPWQPHNSRAQLSSDSTNRAPQNTHFGARVFSLSFVPCVRTDASEKGGDGDAAARECWGIWGHVQFVLYVTYGRGSQTFDTKTRRQKELNFKVTPELKSRKCSSKRFTQGSYSLPGL